MANRITLSDEKILKKYIERGIITLDDVMALDKEAIMNKILKTVHPYSVYYSESDQRWHTQIKDKTAPRGYKEVVRKKEADLNTFLLCHYGIKGYKVYTFENIFDDFMKYKEATQSYGTINMYLKAYNKYYKGESIVQMDLSKINAIDLKIWLCNKIKAYKMSYKSYEQMSVVFNQLFKYAREKGYVEKNPFDAINTKSLGLYNSRKKKSSQKAYSKNEARKVSHLAYEDYNICPNSAAIAVILTFQTGMRVGEVVVLKWKDIDWNEKTINVSRMEIQYQENDLNNRTLGKCKYEVIEGDTKGIFGERIVDLTEDSLFLLRQLKEYYESINLETEWLFVNKNGKRIHNRAMESHLKKYCKEADMKNFKSMHKIRSTYISMLRDAGMSFEKIAEEVGHQSVLTTMNNYSFDVKSDEENKKILNSGLNMLSIN